MTLALVMVGGAIGSVLRHSLIRLNDRWPLGTLLVNVVGSFLLGLTVGAVDDPGLRLAVGAGLLGGFTTFSTFAGEVAARPPAPAAVYAAGSIVGGLVAALLGLAVGGRV